MKRFLCASAVLGMLLMGADIVHAGPLGYKLDITTTYEAGGSGDAGPTGNPDTSVATFTNNGLTTFTGNISLDGTSPNEGHLNTTLAVTLTPGQSKRLTLSTEASNEGGYGPNGMQAAFVGVISIGLNTENVNLTVNDANIHSGVVNGGSEGSDAFVLQGGSPTGLDYGDTIEEAQAPGHFEFFEAPSGVTPEPASMTLLAFGIIGMAGYGWRKCKTAAA
jgi:PEP-CTERM motif-containing protein